MGFLLLILEPSIHVTTGVALVSLWLIGLYGLFFFLISKRWALRKTEGADDPDVRIRDPFEVKFEAFCAEHTT